MGEKNVYHEEVDEKERQTPQPTMNHRPDLRVSENSANI
jgi:hypothetical protein